MKLNCRVAIIPCFNEELSIAQTITRLRRADPSIDIIVVDNNSTDNTQKKAEELSVRVVKEPTPGKGFAFRAGIKNLPSNFETVVLIDGDDTYLIDSEILCKSYFAVEHEGFDMVIGVRNEITVEDENRTRGFRKGHQLGNKFFSRLQSVCFRQKISDAFSGYRILSKGFINSFLAGASKFELETELNAHAFLLNTRIKELDINYAGRSAGSSSKLNTYKDGLSIALKQLSIMKHERPKITYRILSIPWFFVSFYLMRDVLQDYIESGLVPKFPSLIVSVGTLIIGSGYLIQGNLLDKIRLQRVEFARFAYLKARET